MSGLVLGVPQTFYYFQKMQERIVDFITRNSHISAERLTGFMMNTSELVLDVGSVLDGEAAVREGLIDQLGSLHDAIECLHRMIEEGKANGDGQPEKDKA